MRSSECGMRSAKAEIFRSFKERAGVRMGLFGYHDPSPILPEGEANAIAP